MKIRQPRLIAQRLKSVRRRREPVKPRRGICALDIPAWLNAAFTLFLAIFAYEAWDESQRARIIFQRQLTAAQDQIVAAREAQRAWLTLELNIASNFEKLSGDDYVKVGLSGVTYQMAVNYKVRNVGHVPARAVLVKFSHVLAHPIFDFPMQELVARQQKICARPQDLSEGLTIFPEEPPSESNYTIRILRKDSKGPFPSNSYLYLAGCVIYRTGDDNKDHHTAFAYTVEASDGAVFPFPSDPTTIEPGKLRAAVLHFSDLLSAD